MLALTGAAAHAKHVTLPYAPYGPGFRYYLRPQRNSRDQAGHGHEGTEGQGPTPDTPSAWAGTATRRSLRFQRKAHEIAID